MRKMLKIIKEKVNQRGIEGEIYRVDLKRGSLTIAYIEEEKILIEGDISIQGIKLLFGIVVGIGLPSIPKRVIVDKEDC